MIRELLPAWAVSAEAYGDPPHARLLPAEEAVIARAVESRRREFTTVRHCASLALGQLGVPYRPLVPGERGAPTWPTGVVGSMTHCRGYRAAVVARQQDGAALGVDAETDEPLPSGLLEAVSLPRERDRIRALLADRPRLRWDRLLFSAKEAVYKAWFPLTGRLLDFHEADIVFDPERGVFRAALLVPGPRIGGREVAAFEGRWAAGGGLLATAVALPQPASATSRASSAREFTPNLL
ncbi:4'-phosphopantetheinyl transferase superfamily protein [Streptomyces sp. ISL-36]|uniref:4'-phosphopantetheinyl transferase family protein n=1 Tax=Streptomyces sp. ISL-36 TaxID=2819182 RepID=UPI001BEA02F5|nr:4'-phosphopantetheinyl transferase superfamily protein [Streptomyces sp. ISL-36]MBT2442567.1 4'-phosphopantetheinyl transferase superfamily protein [Streptomyces sp. ISL-36]